MIDAEAVWLRLTYTASGNPMDYRVGLVTTQPTYGGRRWWFLCPLVRNDGGPPRRVAKLYLPPGGAYYLSMQRVRFRSADDYAQFSLLFSNVREHLKQLPGFIHLSWWVHPDDPTWFNEVSFWTSKEAIDAWHNVGYHKAAKKWAAESGAIIEDVITNFSLESTRLLRICPCCHRLQDSRYDLGQEQKTLAQPCPDCGFRFPVMKETPDSFAVFKDLEPDLAAPAR